MRSFAPKPVLLILAVFAIVAAIALIQLQFSPATPEEAQSQTEDALENTGEEASGTTQPQESTSTARTESEQAPVEQTTPVEAQKSDEERIAEKAAEFDRAKEITGPTGYINADSVSIREAAGEKVVLLQFWTYSCYNCQNAQPFINEFHEKYADDGLQVIGIHSPEFEFEKEYANVLEAVRQENIQYPVVLDSNWATWGAYNQLYWPAWHLIDADGFIRYRHFGEGAYEETEEKIQELLEEKDRI